MYIIKGIIRVIIALLVFSIGFANLRDEIYLDKQKVKRYERLINEGKETIAILDSVYTETTIRIKSAKIKLYKVDFIFFVKKQKYSGQYYFKHPDSLRYNIKKVKYLENDPNINAIDIEEKIEKAKEDIESNSGLWFSIILLLISILLFSSGIRKIRGPRKVKVAENRSEKSNNSKQNKLTENVEIEKVDRDDPSRFMPK